MTFQYEPSKRLPAQIQQLEQRLNKELQTTIKTLERRH